MKKPFFLMLAVFALLAMGATTGIAQQSNPQTNFPATVRAANPSLYLNFNDLTTGFTDKISGATFSGSATTTTTTATGPYTSASTASSASGAVYFMEEPFTASGALTSINLYYYAAPAGQPLTIAILSGSGTSYTVVSSFTVTPASATGLQTFSAGKGFTPINVTAGEYIGFFAPTDVAPGYYIATPNPIHCKYVTSTFPSGAETYVCNTTATIGITATVGTTNSYTSGTVTPRQPGFDSATPDNTSAAFPYNGFNAAPNNTLGEIDWDVPFSLLVHVDRLNWNRTGTLTLMSKGDPAAGPYWQLVLQMNGTASQLCFKESAPALVAQGACTTAGNDAMPNGFNYDVVVTNNGTGANGATGGGSSSLNVNAVNLYINGILEGVPVAPYGTSFGELSFTVSGGTGYAATTPITVTGGGPNCTVLNYEMLATNGVPTSIGNSASGNPNYGCTSVPTVSLTSPIGTGAVITATLGAPTINAAYPLLVPGYVSANVVYGVAGTNSAQGPVDVDEAAIFPGVLTPTQIGALYYQTKFYQGLLGPRPAVAPAVVEDNDGCVDLDNTWALEEAIALHKLGYINLEGVIQEESGGGNAAFTRQELDLAGLANVPVGVPSDASYYSTCNTAGINTFNASTLALTYPTATQVYRQVFAANPGAPVSIMIGGELNGLANFMQSPADGISALSGAQMFARNAGNGGVLYSQGGVCTASSLPDTVPCTGNIGAQFANTTAYMAAQYVYANGTALPMTAVGGTPAAAGPGPLATRTSKDPTYLWMSSLGTDQRTAWDSLAMSALVTPYFYGGVTVGYAGGTGYAASTLFTSTGGGPNCTVTGYMTASGGVPNGITTLWGAAVPLKDAAGVVAGIGYGCTSAPTLTLVAPTGTGVTLTAYATTVCVAESFPGYSSQSSASSTCNKLYQSNLSQWAVPSSNAPVYTWFLNSLVDAPPVGAPRLK